MQVQFCARATNHSRKPSRETIAIYRNPDRRGLRIGRVVDRLEVLAAHHHADAAAAGGPVFIIHDTGEMHAICYDGLLHRRINYLVIGTDGLYVDNRPMNNKKLTAHKFHTNVTLCIADALEEVTLHL